MFAFWKYDPLRLNFSNSVPKVFNYNNNTLPPVQLFNYQLLNLVHKTVFSPYLQYSRIILLLLDLFMDMKLDTTNFI